MRDIKFRAFNTVTKELRDVVGIAWTKRGVNIDLQSGIGAPTRHKLKVLELMQYTGYKDKNGVEIYEGDIIKDLIDDELGIVIFKKCCFMVKFNEIEISLNATYSELNKTPIVEFWEVVGDIYTNKDLLELKIKK